MLALKDMNGIKMIKSLTFKRFNDSIKPKILTLKTLAEEAGVKCYSVLRPFSFLELKNSSFFHEIWAIGTIDS